MLNNKPQICHIYQYREDIPDNSEHAYAVEDYKSFGSIHDASKITEEIFSDPHNVEYLKNTTYDGYEIAWFSYSPVMGQFSIPFVEIEGLTKVLEPYSRIAAHNIAPRYLKVLEVLCWNKKLEIHHEGIKFNLVTSIIDFLNNTVSMAVSIASVFYCLVRRRKIAVRGGSATTFAPGANAEFRIVGLYKTLKDRNIKFVEFVENDSAKNAIKGLFVRRRPVIYYGSIAFFLSLPSLFKKKPKNNSAHNAAFLLCGGNPRIHKNTIPIFKLIYRLLGIKSMWVRATGSKIAPLLIAAKSSKVKTVGIMHGISMCSFVVGEFIPPYHEKKNLGPDKYGVWSPWFLEYFRRNSKVIDSSALEYSGPLRPHPNTKQEGGPAKPVSANKPRIITLMLISEPLLDPEEIIPFLKTLAADQRFTLSIKIRPSVKDPFYKKLIALMPQAREWRHWKENIFDIGDEVDAFIGTHSTAVLEASFMKKLSMLMRTQKWGDYFNLQDMFQDFDMVAKNPDTICEYILERMQKESCLHTIEKIRYRFFGDNIDGTKWVADELLNYE